VWPTVCHWWLPDWLPTRQSWTEASAVGADFPDGYLASYPINLGCPPTRHCVR